MIPTLVACPQCNKKYKVKPEHVGRKFHCTCQGLIKVVERNPITANIMHCASCGASVGENAKSCNYCGSEIAKAEHIWTGLCPTCFSRTPDKAHNCPHCGTVLEGETLDEHPTHHPCPRCVESVLFDRRFEKRKMCECQNCGGLWVPMDTFTKMMNESRFKHQERIAHSHEDREAFSNSRAQSNERAYIGCPLCKEIMNQKNFGSGSGIIVDFCKDHGVWLDNFELERILQWVQEGGDHRLFKRSNSQYTSKVTYTEKSWKTSSDRTDFSNASVSEVLLDVLKSFFRPL